MHGHCRIRNGVVVNEEIWTLAEMR
jgi:hypothetical protein